MSKKYKHIVVHKITSCNAEYFSSTLNDLEVDGWEFISFMPDSREDYYRFLLKKITLTEIGHNFDFGPM